VGRFFDALKAGVKGFQTANDPVGYTIADKQIRCPHCGETTFFTRRSLLDTRGTAIVDLEWLSPAATILICGVWPHRMVRPRAHRDSALKRLRHPDQMITNGGPISPAEIIDSIESSDGPRFTSSLVRATCSFPAS